MQREQLRHAVEQAESERACRNTLAGRIELFSQTVENVLPKMPHDPIQMISFFETVEDVFKRFAVPADLQTILLNPHLTTKARALLARFDREKSNDFRAVRDFLLEQYHLTSNDYRHRFNTTDKHSQDTYVLYANQLSLLLQYYIRSRGMGNDINLLQSCLISDRIRSSITDVSCQKYICGLEAATENG